MITTAIAGAASLVATAAMPPQSSAVLSIISAATGEEQSAAAGIPAAQFAALQRILRGFRPLRIFRAKLGRPPAGYRRPRAVWIYYTFKPANALDYVHGQWQANVAEGLLRDLSRSHRWPAVAGTTFALILRDGTRRLDSESVIGNAFRGRVRSSSERSLTAIVRESCEAVGVSLIRIRFAHPLGHPTPEITVETKDPRAFLRNEATSRWEIVRPINWSKPPRAEGTFLHVRAADGTWVVVSGYAVRAASGVSMTNEVFK